MQVRWMLLQDDMILDTEVRCEVGKVDVLGETIYTNDGGLDEHGEGHQVAFITIIDGSGHILDHFIFVL